MTEQDYKNLVTSEYQNSTKFMAMISLVTSAYVQIQNLYAAMIPLFDVDVAVGQQLDVIGQWVGITRNVSIPIAGVYFSWDDVYTKGWEFGTWQPPLSPVSITTLPEL